VHLTKSDPYSVNLLARVQLAVNDFDNQGCLLLDLYTEIFSAVVAFSTKYGSQHVWNNYDFFWTITMAHNRFAQTVLLIWVD
jgi:hypothetical protein